MLSSAGARRSPCMGQEREDGTLRKDGSSEVLSGCI